MKKLALLMVSVLCASMQANPDKNQFTFKVADNLPEINVKVQTKNKKIGHKKIPAGKKRSATIGILEGDDIDILTIMTQCGGETYCEQIDEIYIGSERPEEEKRREKNVSEQGTFVEKVRRYNQPDLKGKTQFKIGKGVGIVGFFQVDPVE